MKFTHIETLLFIYLFKKTASHITSCKK